MDTSTIFSISLLSQLVYSEHIVSFDVVMASSHNLLALSKSFSRAIMRATQTVRRKTCQPQGTPLKAARRAPSTNWSHLPFEIKSKILQSLVEIALEEALEQTLNDLLTRTTLRDDFYLYSFSRWRDIHNVVIAAPELLQEIKAIGTMMRSGRPGTYIVPVYFMERFVRPVPTSVRPIDEEMRIAIRNALLDELLKDLDQLNDIIVVRKLDDERLVSSLLRNVSARKSWWRGFRP